MTARMIRFDEISANGNHLPLYVHPADVNTIRFCEDDDCTELRVHDNVFSVREAVEECVRRVNEGLAMGDEEEAKR